MPCWGYAWHPPMPPQWPPGHHPARTVGLAALHPLDAEEQVLVPQVLQVRQDGVQLHMERGVLGGAAAGRGGTGVALSWGGR